MQDFSSHKPVFKFHWFYSLAFLLFCIWLCCFFLFPKPVFAEHPGQNHIHKTETQFFNNDFISKQKKANRAYLSTQAVFPFQSVDNQTIHNNKYLMTKTDYYSKAKEYFSKRNIPLHHFLNIGIGAILIESFYPFKTTAYPFFVYISYRKEKWGQVKIPIIFSFQYEPLFNPNSRDRIHGLTGVRYPTSFDLTLFHVDLMAGFSLPAALDFEKEKPALELRLLFTHIIGSKASSHRLYFQWGAKARLKERFLPGFVIQIGLDNHL